MNKYEIYVPLKFNDGTVIEAEEIRQIRRQLMAVFGAITVSPLSAPFQGTGGMEESSLLTTSFELRSLRRKSWSSSRTSTAAQKKDSSNRNPYHDVLYSCGLIRRENI